MRSPHEIERPVIAQATPRRGDRVIAGWRAAALGFGLLLASALAAASHAAASTSSGTIASAAAGSASAAPAPGDPAGAPARVWDTLRYRGRNLLARFSVELEMELPGAKPEAGAAGAPQNDWVAELRTRLESALLSDKASRHRATFDPITGVVRRLTQLSLGPRPDYKRYEFGDRGVTRRRTKPASGQALGEPERWPGGRSSFHAYDPDALGCRVVSNPAALAWWLTWGPAAPSGPFRDPGACYFLGKTLYRVEIVPLDPRSTQVDYQVVRSGTSTRRSGRVRTERYRVVSRPIAGKLSEKTVVAEIALDAENRLPLRFVTQEGPLEVDVELDQAVLRPPALLVGDASGGG